MKNTRKVVLVGTGFVGMSMAYALECQGGINELVLIDVLKDKAEGEAMDLSHASSFASNRMIIKTGDYDECKDADVVVITAGMAQKPGQTRLELLQVNVNITKEIAQNIMKSGFDGVIVIATNPVDLISYTVQKVTKLPKGRVVGSGTILDTARLKYFLGKEFSVSPKSVNAYIMGEHGDSSLAVWSQCNIGGKPIVKVLKDQGKDESELDRIYKDVQQSAYEIINKKKATYYGIGLGLATLVQTILNDEHEILPVSTYIDGNYGHSGLYIGVPAVVSKDGVVDILNIELSEKEQQEFDHSFEVLDELRKEVDGMLD